MSQRPDVTIVTHFSGLEDPRVDRRKLHSLINVVVIALSAIICGAEGWTDVELFGQAKGKWVAEFLDKPEQWPAFQTIVMVRAERRVGDQVEVETGYFISSLPSDAQQVLAAVRQHWHIENRVHWVLDVTFREDESRIRIGHAAQNMAVLRHMALNLIKREQTSRRSIRGKRLKAGWDEDYLTRVLCANEDAIALWRILSDWAICGQACPVGAGVLLQAMRVSTLSRDRNSGPALSSSTGNCFERRDSLTSMERVPFSSTTRAGGSSTDG